MILNLHKRDRRATRAHHLECYSSKVTHTTGFNLVSAISSFTAGIHAQRSKQPLRHCLEGGCTELVK
jgi:hypothetical protein